MIRTRTEGFSLVELMIVMAVIAVLAGMTVPTIAAGMKRYTVLSAGQEVAGVIRSARMQAISRNATLTVQLNIPAAGQYRIVDVGGNVLGVVHALPTGLTVSGIPYFQFTPQGRLPAGSPAVTVVVSNGTANDNRTITVSPSGRVQLP